MTPAHASSVSIDLEQPIKRGETSIAQIELRRPNAGELRGLHMSQLLAMQTDAILTLLPRICTPILMPHEMNQLDPSDLVMIGYSIVEMTAPKSMRHGLQK